MCGWLRARPTPAQAHRLDAWPRPRHVIPARVSFGADSASGGTGPLAAGAGTMQRKVRKKKLPIEAMFERLDKDGSGMLDKQEIHALMKLLDLALVRHRFLVM